MTMTSKICNYCGSEVDENTHFCPNCKSQSFRKKGELIKADNSLKHRMFYLNYNNQYIMSKTKLASIVVFVMFTLGALTANMFGAFVFLLGIFFAIIIWAAGYVIQKLVYRPSPAQLDYNDEGFMPDLIHTLFYWQDKATGAFVLSKTKIISWIIFILSAAWSTLPGFNTAFLLFFASIFAVPAFIIGFVIHKLTYRTGTVKQTNKPHKPKTVKEAPKVEDKKPEKVINAPAGDEGPDPRLEGYRNEVESLRTKFKAKDKAVRELIEKRFAPPQLTYTRFITSVDNAKTLFDKQSASALNIINLASEYSPRIEKELDSKLDILKTIISKLDDLTNELVITMDESKDEEVHNLIDDMDNLISTVDDYK